MCGIWGWYLSRPVEQGNMHVLAALLAVYNESRGRDSFGSLSYNLGEKPVVHRALGLISQQAQFDKAPPLIYLGHTRAASTGSVTLANAHPFEIGTIIGAHNGMVYNHEELNKRYRRSFKVDSQHIFAHLAEGRSLRELDGWGAIEYMDTRKPEEVYVGLAQQGDLAIAGIGVDEDHVNGVAWSSDEQHLTKALHAANIPFFLYQVHHGRLYMITQGEIVEAGACKIRDRSRSRWVSPGGSMLTTPQDPWWKQWKDGDDEQQCSSCLQWYPKSQTFPVQEGRVFLSQALGQWICVTCHQQWIMGGKPRKEKTC